jgi:nucleoside-diphosphate-sugar epimerase
MTDRETILVTGASGFIGGWLVETLHLGGDARVRAGIRSWSSAARLARFPLEIVPCDVMNKEQIAQALVGASVVVHCATGLRDVIVQGTRNMLEVASQLGIRRFIHMSTTEVYGNVSGEISEETPYQYTGSEYGDSKIEAEKLCWEFCREGLPVTVLRPPIVYGPFNKDWTVRMAHRLQSGSLGILEGYGEGNCNLVYVTDIVAAILLAIEHEHAVGQAFQVNGPELITWNQYFQRLNTALGLPALKTINPSGSSLRAAVLRPIKASARFALDHFEGPLQSIYERFRGARAIMQFTERSIKATPTFSDLSLYNRKAIYLSSKAQQMLGYHPKFGIDAGLEMSVRWLDHLGLVS